MLAITAIRAGIGDFSTSQSVSWPPGIDVQRLVEGRPSRIRSIPVTLHINHEGKEHCLKFLAYRDVFQRLAESHRGDEASDVRFGDLLRMAMWEGQAYASRSKTLRNKIRKLFPRIAWKTAAWLGPALLKPMMSAFKDRAEIIKTIQSCMSRELPRLKITPKNMAAFLVYRNWQNWTARRRDLVKAPKWPTTISPIASPGKKSEYGSGDFWDEIFNRQLKLKRFPWARLQRTNQARVTELTEQAIEERKACYAQNNPGFDWEECQQTHPHLYDKLIAKFLEEHMTLYPFSINVEFPKDVVNERGWCEANRCEWKEAADTENLFCAVPTQGPQFLLPKSFEETVRDILLNRDVFILSP